MRYPLLAKFVSIGFVLALMALALMRIGFLVDERRERQREAVRSVEQSHAGEQTLMGPWVQKQCVEEWDVATGEGSNRKLSVERRQQVLRLVPDRLVAGGQLRNDVRQRGLYRINTYGGPLQLDASWAALPALELQRERSDSRWQCEPARVVVAISDVRGVRAAQLMLDGRAAALRAGTHSATYPSGLHAELPAQRAAGSSLQVALKLDLAGTGQLSFVPAAEATEWKLVSDWPHPSFGGRFLPSQRAVSAGGFESTWQVSGMATAAPAQLQQGVPLCRAAAAAGPYAHAAEDTTGPRCLDTLTVAFFDPVNPYVLSDRAIKYGLLFVVLTFVAVALVEVLSGRRVHPVQYLLVGLALSLFFLLLLSLSEHLAFERAYAAAAGACATLLAYYGAHMLGRWLAGAAFGAAIGLLYGLLYLLLQMEQNALAVGSVGLFAALTGVMVATRRIDWYALFDGWRSGNPGVTT
ncbi:MAG: cell envelope integrity protein CreD [Burkholderiales bacterium]|nr:cell envelope integrity protein CreD [Burkholderiales bacterium]